MKIETLLWSGSAVVCAVMMVLVVVSVVQLKLIDQGVANLIRASRHESLAREIAEQGNSMRRFQLSTLVVAADERDKELERVAQAGEESGQLAEELERTPRGPETRQLAGNIRMLI